MEVWKKGRLSVVQLKKRCIKTKKPMILLLLLVMVFFLSCNNTYATNSITEQNIEENQTESVNEVEIEKEELPIYELKQGGLFLGEEIKISKETGALNDLITQMVLSVKEDAVNGLESLKEVVPTRDNIEMKVWGGFLSKYVGKTETEYPNEDIVFSIGETQYRIKPTKVAKEWLRLDVIPKLLDGILDVSENYPTRVYKLGVIEGQKLVDVDIDITNDVYLGEYTTLYPLRGGSILTEVEYLIYNTGVSYGVLLNKDYVNSLKGYHNELPHRRGLDKEIPSCVDILAYITIPKNIKGLTMSDKTLRDMAIYKGLAVNLVTKELVDTNDLTTQKEEIRYKDFKIDETKLILISLEDAVVVVQPTYLECVRWGTWNLGLLHTVDLTDFLIGKSTTIQVSNMNVDISTYISDDGYIGTELGNAPFLLYSQHSKLPYDRFIMWLYSDASKARMSTEQRDTIVEQIGVELKNQGRTADFEMYLKAVGQGGLKSKKLLIVGLAFVLLIIITVVVIINKKKVKKRENDLLFEVDDYDDYD